MIAAVVAASFVATAALLPSLVSDVMHSDSIIPVLVSLAVTRKERPVSFALWKVGIPQEPNHARISTR